MTDHLQEFVDSYYDYNGISAARRTRAQAQLVKLQTFIDKPLHEATSQEFAAYAAMLAGAEQQRPNTVRFNLNLIRPFWRYLREQGIFTREQLLDMTDVKPPRGASGKSDPKPYAPAEIRALLKRVDVDHAQTPANIIARYERGTSAYRRVWHHGMRLQLRLAIMLGLFGGLRPGETYRLSVEDLDPANDYIPVAGAVKGEHRGETVRAREVPWTDDLRAAAAEWLAFRAMLLRSLSYTDHGCPWIVLDPRNTPFNTPYNPTASPMDGVSRRTFNTWASRLGFNWNRLRHTAGTEWLRAGVPLEYVSRLLGHATLAQTLAYAELTTADLSAHTARAQERFARRLSALDPKTPAPEYEAA